MSGESPLPESAESATTRPEPSGVEPSLRPSRLGRLLRSRVISMVLLTACLGLGGLYLRALREGVQLRQLLQGVVQENAAYQSGRKELENEVYRQRQHLGQAEALVELLALPRTRRVAMLPDPSAGVLLLPHAPPTRDPTREPAPTEVQGEAQPETQDSAPPKAATSEPAPELKPLFDGSTLRTPQAHFFVDEGNRRLALFAFALHSPAKGEVFQLWGTDVEQKRVSLGLLPPAVEGVQMLFVPLQKPLTQLELTLEPGEAGGASRRLFFASMTP